MSTDYGEVTIQFPGFPAICFSTINCYAMCPSTKRPWDHNPPNFLPSRKIVATDGTVLRLSRKDRGRLRTLVKKWNKRNGSDGQWIKDTDRNHYRTIEERWF